MNRCFTNPNAWGGGTFDALMYFKGRSVSEACRITTTLWAYSRLDGPFRVRHVEPEDQTRIITPDFTDDGCEQLVGRYRHLDESFSPFVHTTIIDPDGLWVYAGIPMGGMPISWDVGAYPFDDGKPMSWLLAFIEQLREMVAYMSAEHDITAATYGWLDVYALDSISDALAGRIPPVRWHAVEVWHGGTSDYYPMTNIGPLFT